MQCSGSDDRSTCNIKYLQTIEEGNKGFMDKLRATRFAAHLKRSLGCLCACACSGGIHRVAVIVTSLLVPLTCFRRRRRRTKQKMFQAAGSAEMTVDEEFNEVHPFLEFDAPLT